MAQRSSDYIGIQLPPHEELAKRFAGANKHLIERLPEIWEHLTEDQKAEVATLVPELAQTVRRLLAVTSEARRQVQIKHNRGLKALLQSWAETDDEDVAEQRETLAFLKTALDADRLSDRPLFP